MIPFPQVVEKVYVNRGNKQRINDSFCSDLSERSITRSERNCNTLGNIL